MATDEEFRRARSLVLEHGWNATAYQILNPGIDLWFSAGGEGVVGYVRHRATLVVAGAPICAPDRLQPISAEFMLDARKRGLRVCYFGAGERLESTYAGDSSWSRVLLGAQPVWDPREWSHVVARRASLRAQFNRARNKKVHVVEWNAARAENDAALRTCLNEWLATRGLPPLHFLVEPETLNHLADRRLFVAEREGFGVVAFTVLSPVPARRGWLFEQIVRGRNAPNGTSESLIDCAMRAIGASGASYATLGLSPLSGHASVSTPREPFWLRVLLGWVKLHGTRFYNFRGLDSFKAKFDPEKWEPIYAIAQGTSFSPAALYAIAGAFSGGTPIRLIARAALRAAREELWSLLRKLRSRPVADRQARLHAPRA